MLPEASPPGSLTARIALLKRTCRTIDSVVNGSSMEPAIPRGTRIRISAQSELPPNGTAVAIMAPAGVITHRLVCRGRLPWNRGFVLTQGDATMLCDPPLPIELLVGPVDVEHANGAYGAVPKRRASAPAMRWRSRLWRLLVRAAFVAHPICAAMLVRCSLRGRVERVQWPA